MLGLLKANHNAKISMTSLKRKLKEMGLSEVSNVSDETVRQIIQKEIQGPSAVHGYRSVCGKLKTTYGIQVKQDTVMNNLREEDPKENQGQLFDEFTLVKDQTACGMWMETIKSNHTVFPYMLA